MAKKNSAKRKVTKKKIKSAAKTKKKSQKKISVKQKKVVSIIPKGYNNITPYLIINHAASAIDFYKKVFGAKEVMRMEKDKGRIGHAELKFGDTKIMLADEYPEMDARSPEAYGGTPVSIHLYIKDVDSVVAKAVSEGATLLTPIENMFYGDRTATLIDPFGHKWHVSTHIEDVTLAEMTKRMAKFMK